VSVVFGTSVETVNDVSCGITYTADNILTCVLSTVYSVAGMVTGRAVVSVAVPVVVIVVVVGIVVTGVVSIRAAACECARS
jgi:hypothetical protein